MNISHAKELFRKALKDYFGENAIVIYANQSRAVKPKIKLVTIAVANPKRYTFPPLDDYGEYMARQNLTQVEFTVDLFTHGSPVYYNGAEIGTENTALDEMYGLKDYFESEAMLEWANKNDVAVMYNGDPQDMTGLINDVTYEYRSRFVIIFYFTHRTNEIDGKELL